MKKKEKQTINSLNNDDVPVKMRDKGRKNYKEKYELDPAITNKYAAWVTNPTVQPDGKTEMGVPIPSTENVEYSKEYGEDHQM